VDEKRHEFEHIADELDLAEQRILDEDIDATYVAPSTEHLNEQHRDVDRVQEIEDPYKNYDIGADIGLSDRPGSDSREEQIRNRVSDEEFRADVRSLNQKQREFFDHVLKKVKTTDDQFFFFLTGGAGVGKSKVTKTLHQALLRHFNTAAGDNPEQVNLLLTAPTGKAAYLIGGNTIHSAFHVPANQSMVYKSLAAEKLNTLRTKLGNLKVLFIDEISMCGSNLFSFIDCRLQDVMQRKIPFGGVSVITIGDLFQLHPVMDRWIFKSATVVGDLSVLAPNVWIDNIEMFELT